MRQGFAALLALLAVPACGHSPPTHLFTLDAVAPRQMPERSDGPPVIVGKIMIPATLDRLSVIVRTGPDQLDTTDNARWAAPLDEMIRRVVAQNLRQRLGESRVYLPGDPVPPGPALTVTLNLQSFVGSRNGDVILDGDWFVQDHRQKLLLMRHAHLTRQVDGRDISTIVNAQSGLLATLSDRIGTEMALLPRSPEGMVGMCMGTARAC